MSKIWLVIKREYLSRVRKRSFIIMTILGPLLVAGFYGLLIWIALSEEERPHTVMVVDSSEMQLGDELKTYAIRRPQSKLRFTWKYDNYHEAKDHIYKEDYNSILFIPRDPVNNPKGIFMGYKDRPGMSTMRAIEIEMEKLIEEQKMVEYNITKEQFDNIRTKLSIKDQKIDESGGEQTQDSMMQYMIAFIFGLLIYMFILLYGVQVLRGVMEEKTSRIVEVMVSSVRPFQLMMGKIIGIALVGLTQFLIWVLFSGTVMAAIGAAVAPSLMSQIETGSVEMQSEVAGMDVGSLLGTFGFVDFFVMLPLFVFYFIGGYLLYAALFAAIGSAVDSETDSQQFMLPVTLPLIFSFVIGQMVLKNPEGTLARVFSMIPFTSPIVMMIRLPFGIKEWQWELPLSMFLLVAGFVITTWLAGRIYRTGILMYGKKVTYRELFKWLFYKG